MALFSGLNRTRLALHIEPQELRLLVFKGQNLVRWRVQPLPEGIVQNNLLAEPERFADLLTKACTALEYRGNKVVLSINHARAILRVLNLPPVPDKMLPQAVQREARREFPLPLEELYLTWRPLENGKSRHQIFTVGLPRTAVDSYLEGIHRANLRPVFLDFKALALVRAVNHPDVLIVDVEPETNYAFLVREFIPYLARFINMPVTALSSALERGVYLTSEIQRILDFYRSSMAANHSPWNPQLCLTGRLADEADLREQITELWPLVDPHPPLDLPPDFPLATYLPTLGLLLKRG